VENKKVIEPKDIILESALLSTMSHKQNFNLYIHSVDKKRLLPATSLILADYARYFEMFKLHETVDFGQFQTQFTQNWHNKDLDQLDIEYYRDYVFPAIQKAEGTEHCLLGLMNKQTTDELIEVANNHFDVTKLREILEKHENKEQLILLDHDNEAITATTVDLSVLDKTNGIPYFLPSLQTSLGGLIQGQFVVVSADSNTGKSAFCISQAVHAFTHFDKQPDRGPILYFNSEGTPGDIFGRFWSNLFKKQIPGGIEDIVTRREEVREKFNARFDSSKFVVFQMGTSGISYIRAKLKKYKPSLVIIDMLDILAQVEDPITLKKLYDNIRLLSLEFCAIIGTTQSGNTTWFDKESGAEKSKKFLTDKDVLGCKAKSAAAETMITIGKDSNNPKLRYISTPKKKRGIMCNLTCEIEDSYSLYKEITF
jgi:AAA domain-containing protein